MASSFCPAQPEVGVPLTMVLGHQLRLRVVTCVTGTDIFPVRGWGTGSQTLSPFRETPSTNHEPSLTGVTVTEVVRMYAVNEK